MINIEIMCIGKIKEKPIIELLDEYKKRISKYAKLDIIEFPDESLANITSEINETKVKDLEAEKIIKKLENSKSYIIALSPNGKMYDSLEFSEKLENIAVNSYSTITFLIGGSIGLSDKLLNIANEKISFSKLTFPHKLFRVILLEQIYRAFKIANNETYHK